MRRGDVRSSECGGLIVIITITNDLGHRFDEFSKIEISRCVISGITTEHDERLNGLRLDRRSERRNRRGTLGRHRHKINRPPDVTEMGVDRISQHLHRRGLMGTGDHEAGSAMLEQIFSALLNPLLLVRKIQPMDQRRVGISAENFTREGRREGQNLATAETQAMIRHAARQRKAALDHIQAIHRIRRLGDATALGKITRVVKRPSLSVEKIRIEADNPLSGREAVDRLDVGAKSSLRRRGNWLILHGLIFSPNGPRENILELGHETRARRGS